MIHEEDAAERLTYLEGLTGSLRNSAAERGYATITEALETVEQRAVREQGVGE